MVRAAFLKGRISVACICALVCFAASLAWKTWSDLLPVPDSLDVGRFDIVKPQVVDRNGRLLSITYLNHWNISPKPLHEFPDLLARAFIESEDGRFYRHGGVDWLARIHALFQNILAGRAVRGASTITEQVVRMLHPRPRTVWSRWLEGIEAARLENRFSKSEILEFYLNQVPYAHQRRGAAEAAIFYFDRDLQTLNIRETLALAVLVRAPSRFDLKRGSKAMENGLLRLAGHMYEGGYLSDEQYVGVRTGKFEFSCSDRIIEASHFVQQVLKGVSSGIPVSGGTVCSTLDGHLQRSVQGILASRLEALRESDVGNGAVLVVDNSTSEVLAWVSGSTPGNGNGSWMDGVTIPRQPGSTLKPFLYALAMELGWTPATIIDDSPLAQPVRSGIHNFHNYSRTYYGPLRLREALGNSLNTPAVRAIQFTGTARFLEWLHLLGIGSLKQQAEYYGQGLALGSGEVSLFELVQAYTVFARRGEFRRLRILSDFAGMKGNAYFSAKSVTGSSSAMRVSEEATTVEGAAAGRIMDEKTAAMISDVLSDPNARRLEFGEGHLLRFPVQTAIKTGTSTDHRDCWAVGFSSSHTVGVWMGNFDRSPTMGVTGAIGPALVLRSIFAELNRYQEPRPFAVGDGLVSIGICARSGYIAGPGCPEIKEMFAPEHAPRERCPGHARVTPASANYGAAVIKTADSQVEHPRESYGKTGEHLADSPENYVLDRNLSPVEPVKETVRLIQPVQGLEIAWDPRIPAELQVLAFKLPKKMVVSRVEWVVDGRIAAQTNTVKYLWPVSRGVHKVRARVSCAGEPDLIETPEVTFTVK